VPTYSPDDAGYRQRVHANGRGVDQTFGAEELLFRRFPKTGLVNGWPMPMNLAFDASGVSVNRSRYSVPQDVLEPDCCNGNARSGQVVLEFAVGDIPIQFPADTPEYRFTLKHDPRESCYPHSLIWCNADGDAGRPCLRPPKTIRDLFRAELLPRMQSAGRAPREFTAIETVPPGGPEAAAGQ
jgi:hypothetical protein